MSYTKILKVGMVEWKRSWAKAEKKRTEER
jgi:hypothetical protein